MGVCTVVSRCAQAGRVSSTAVKYGRWGSKVELVVEVMQSTASRKLRSETLTFQLEGSRLAIVCRC